MSVTVPSLTSKFALDDVESIIAYIWNRAMRTPKYVLPRIDHLLVSIPGLCAQFGHDADLLCENIQNALQSCYNRIFDGERQISVRVSPTVKANGQYDITTTVAYVTRGGEYRPIATKISLIDGRLAIPEYTTRTSFLSTAQGG